MGIALLSSPIGKVQSFRRENPILPNPIGRNRRARSESNIILPFILHTLGGSTRQLALRPPPHVLSRLPSLVLIAIAPVLPLRRISDMATDPILILPFLLMNIREDLLAPTQVFRVDRHLSAVLPHNLPR